MPVNPRNVGKMLQLGAKYGPAAAAAAKSARDPAVAAAQRAVTNVQARKRALGRASTVRDGSAVKTFDRDERVVWVVLSGDEPIATHPVTDTPMEELLRHVDLTKRVRPGN